ncbi:FCD domain-containing protein [Robbsia sp. KACC 23696]|uniref:FadR/GntR family transcriptional regulator n=1 Tax=Robbsia sp. KACC 23696 TaxID=3149231 RepID=UPI00325A7C54
MSSPPIDPSDAAPTTRSDHAYAQLIVLLDEGDKTPHTRLPGEQTLSRQFGVSRPVLRQALTRLHTEGRIYSKKGAGHFVSEIGAQGPVIALGTLASLADVRRFLDFRCSLEGESARLAALARSRGDLARIQQCRRRLEAAFVAGESGIQQDIAFHVAIAHATGNRFFAHTIAALSAPMQFSIRLVRDLSEESPDARRKAVVREHARVAEAIADRAPDAARAAMIAHLQQGIIRLFGEKSV